VPKKQVTCYYISLPLPKCSFNFATVPLDRSQKITKDPESGELQLQASILDIYAPRDISLSSLNLYQFIANYTTIQGQVRKQSAPVIVGTFPTYSANPNGERYAQFCHVQLLKDQPWTSTTQHSWQTDSTHITVFW